MRARPRVSVSTCGREGSGHSHLVVSTVKLALSGASVTLSVPKVELTAVFAVSSALAVEASLIWGSASRTSPFNAAL